MGYKISNNLRRKVRSKNNSELLAIPKDIQRILDIGTGDYVEFIVKGKSISLVKAAE